MADDKDRNSSNDKREISGSFIRGFAAGVILSHINKNLILGLLIGTLAGCYVQQNYTGIPDVSETATEWVNTLKESIKKKSK
jgi:hypothetical protein